jgi:hypothetical protein
MGKSKHRLPRTVRHRHVDSQPSLTWVLSSVSLSASAIRTRKTKDVITRNFEYAGALSLFPLSLESYLKFYSHDARATSNSY